MHKHLIKIARYTAIILISSTPLPLYSADALADEIDMDKKRTPAILGASGHQQPKGQPAKSGGGNQQP